MLSLRLKEFLLGGPIDKEAVIEESKSMDLPLSTNRVQFLKQLEIDSNALVSEWRNFESEELKTQSSFESVLKAVSEFRSKIDDPDLVGKMQHYTLLQSQVQILILSQKLADLQNFSHVRCIPDLVQNLMNSLPKNLQSSCKIYKNIILGVSELKCSLLRSFHADFDAHLETNAESTDAKEMWSAFLGIARDWLLAYALVSLLPALISDSRNSIIEKYTDALDEVLTPLWGRFHFHLSSARESKSFEQFVWTFSYSKSFLTLLIDLCTQLTSTGQLQKLSAGHPLSVLI